jgi:hypothetical protein
MGDVLRLVFVHLLESSNSQFAVAQHDELREEKMLGDELCTSL